MKKSTEKFGKFELVESFKGSEDIPPIRLLKRIKSRYRPEKKDVSVDS